jgi:hypothetical protein
MKKLIVIDSYLTSTKKREYTKRTNRILENIGFDIMLVAHYPICIEIQFMVDYFIFDKNQTLDPVEDALITGSKVHMIIHLYEYSMVDIDWLFVRICLMLFIRRDKGI